MTTEAAPARRRAAAALWARDSADVGVVEQDEAPVGDAAAERRWHREGSGRGVHVPDGFARPVQQAASSARPAAPTRPRRPGPGTRAMGEPPGRTVEGTGNTKCRRPPASRGDARPRAVVQEAGGQRADDRRRTGRGPRRRRLLVPHEHRVERPGQRAQPHRQDRRQHHAEAAGDQAAGEAHPVGPRCGAAAQAAGPGDRGPAGRRGQPDESGSGVGRCRRKVPVARLIELAVGVAHAGLAVGHLLGHAHHLAAEGVRLALERRTHAFGLHLERAPGAGLARESGVDGEVHGGIEKEGVDPGLVTPWGLQARSVGDEGAGHPAEVLAVHAVAGEGAADQLDDRHAAVAQPAVHVLAVRLIERQTLAGGAGRA